MMLFLRAASVIEMNVILRCQNQYELLDGVMEARDRFEAQIVLQRPRATGGFYAPATYQKGFDNEDE